MRPVISYHIHIFIWDISESSWLQYNTINPAPDAIHYNVNYAHNMHK